MWAACHSTDSCLRPLETHLQLSCLLSTHPSCVHARRRIYMCGTASGHFTARCSRLELQHLKLMTRACNTIAQDEEITTERRLLTKQSNIF